MQERLQKLIAQAGIASRRGAEELIKAGEVTVNGEIITTLGTKANPETDHIKVGGKLINTKLEKRENVYILLNKPKGYLSSAADPEGRKLVTDLVKGYGKLHPVGRLDYNTEGLIILTNDGEFTNTVASSKRIPKVYEVKVKGIPTEVAINKLRRGTLLEDGFKTAPAEIKILKPTAQNGWYECSTPPVIRSSNSNASPSDTLNTTASPSAHIANSTRKKSRSFSIQLSNKNLKLKPKLPRQNCRHTRGH